ncbi:MAG: hypothetical protein ONB46_06010 [candidate division KSB1 bacterium]|nr:hypothetical protein [candidate division KSB1 bacterium]MDZ7365258.1 hypothetical protein [candidate division KSB1 bacterium]MDZ7403125.1 hypothetical protein [candidate division KSB1 bacterium]
MKISSIVLGLLVLASLCAWAHYSSPYPDLTEILAHPEQFAGKRVGLFIETRVAEPTVDGFILTQRGHRLRVHTDIKDVPANEFVAVAGIFEPPDRLHAASVRHAKGRRWKIAVSVIPVLLLVFLLPLALRFDRQTRSFILRQKPHA